MIGIIEPYNFTNYLDYKQKTREDKDNIFPVGISDRVFVDFVIDYLLGEDWYVTDPLGREQINEIALTQILEKYSKKYRKETRKQK